MRRSAQLLAVRPDLEILPLRGNVDTRVAKVLAGAYDAIVLAAAGVRRLGLAGEISVPLPLEAVLPAPGQGALAVQCRADDLDVREWLAVLDDAAVREATAGERGFLEGLGGGCLAPIAAHAAVSDGSVTLRGAVLTPDGARGLVVTREGPVGQGREVGLRAAEAVIAEGALALLR